MLSFLPFGYAFSAGVVTMFSPCSVAMLPTYVSMYLGSNGEQPSRRLRAGRAVLFSLIATVGYVVLSALVGGIVVAGGQSIVRVAPWVAALIGIALIGLGIWMLIGGYFAIAVFGQLANRVQITSRRSPLGFLIFGAVYAIAALSCTLPIFLAVVGGAFAAGGLGHGVLQFVSYSLGMGTVMVIIALGVVLFYEALRRWLKRWTPLVNRLGGVLLVISGGYLLYYWFTTGELLALLGR